ncbi:MULTISPECIES: recombinase family protein [unclassified Streptomyces]|uniref:recombinase family protein n=1 Tax=unclassified Streptomyces TaxID=2593676 RepID=UPI00386CFED5
MNGTRRTPSRNRLGLRAGWRAYGPALAVAPAIRTERPVRIGYARTSTARQGLASRLEPLHRAECHKAFKEQISTRVKVRPELEKALAPTHHRHRPHPSPSSCAPTWRNNPASPGPAAAAGLGCSPARNPDNR